ncbi:MAG TPA: redox-sensing transcriptional repressor Rex [Thermomicrobiales bacterium]|jgi:redox-sensing transcriptional repressor|nr:redox-sensing transcriptional repressor Rex [Chloroflexota bacterium]HBY46071.1 redox-sensing transcriptional repressor Rex [Chloroflexota bacterium]HCG28865.1 redox-sensing transcriptional repressor Rex [Chloroflexota bacterium]HQX62601.1 redox-sensing transcriptional repressor Rex [Thermomicrobiales bacterium]HRA32206.1 redox-sensing transcriptional repressor Rex [Thermomicrobiales bacterium]
MGQAASDSRADRAIPDIVIRRLPIYVRTLRLIASEGIPTVSSDDLARLIGVTAAQIRRDLSYFGRFGKQGKGYNVATLVATIEHILHLDQQWDVALVGFGHLGQALAAYRGFGATTFEIVAIFDRSPAKVGQTSEDGVPVLTADEITRVVRERDIRMGIIAVPASAGQEVADALVAGGVRAILNYAPVILRVPEDVWVREIDPTGAMQSMTYYLNDDAAPPDSSTERYRRAALEATPGW